MSGELPDFHPLTVIRNWGNNQAFRLLGNDDSVDALLGNLQAKFFCQNSGDTNEWASKLLGERYVQISSTSFSRSEQGASGGASRSEQKRAYVEPARFTTLKRGAEICNFMVECIAYKGGTIFEDGNPYKLLVFKQS